MAPTAGMLREPNAWRALGLTDDEYGKIVELLGREPNDLELGMFSVMWSEHCAYKHSRHLFGLFPTEGPRLLQGPGENAGIVDIGDGLAVVFKVESHNHPSAVEPYQGAATGVGGILRDIIAMGARPIAVLDSLRFGPLDDPRARYLFDRVVAGIAGYGNAIGVPTVGGEVIFDPSYRDNPLVNAMAVGLVEHRHIARAAAQGAGNAVMVVGARTGRDGIHGASFASASLDGDTAAHRLSVQVGDPFTGKLLLEACLEMVSAGLVVAIQDMGAAGLTSSSAEMAARGSVGIRIDVTKVPCRETGMTPYEIMLSESQERMLLIPKAGAQARVQEICRRWGLEAATIGQVTDDGILRVVEGDRTVAAVPAAALSTACAPSYRPTARRPAYLEVITAMAPPDPPADLGEALLELLASPNIASKAWVFRQYDHTVRASTVAGPGDADAAVLRIRGSRRGVAVTLQGNGRYCYLNPYRGAQIAVAEAARNLSCVGAEPVAVTDGLNFGNPEKPEVYWQFEQAVRGIADACRILGTPVTGGNVSFYNETDRGAIYPTPVIGMVGVLEDVTRHVGMGWRQEGDVIVLLGENRDELGGSEYLALRQVVAGDAPALDLDRERRVQALCRDLIRDGIARSAHDTSDGGLSVALAEACLAGGKGARVRVEAGFRADSLLFSESQSRIVLSVTPGLVEETLRRAAEAGVPAAVLGEVGGEVLEIDLGRTPGAPGGAVTVTLDDMARRYFGAVPAAMDGPEAVRAYVPQL